LFVQAVLQTALNNANYTLNTRYILWAHSEYRFKPTTYSNDQLNPVIYSTQ